MGTSRGLPRGAHGRARAARRVQAEETVLDLARGPDAAALGRDGRGRGEAAAQAGARRGAAVLVPGAPREDSTAALLRPDADRLRAARLVLRRRRPQDDGDLP